MEVFDYLVECNFTESQRTIDNVYTAHGKHELFLLLDGDLTALVNSKRYHIQNGALVLLAAGDLHLITNNFPERIYRRITMHFDPKVIQMFNTQNTNLLACFNGKADGEHNILFLDEEQVLQYTEYASNIAPFWNSKMYGDDITAITSLTRLLLMVNRIYTLQKNPVSLPCSAPVAELIQYIDNHIGENIKLHELARSFSYSESYISSLFSSQMGVTLKHYINTKKIAYAKELLADNHSVTAVCEKSGFNDYCNFKRTFKKITGSTPKQWQKQNANSIALSM